MFDLLVLTSLDQLLFILKLLLIFKSNLNEGVNCTEPFPLVSIPSMGWQNANALLLLPFGFYRETLGMHPFYQLNGQVAILLMPCLLHKVYYFYFALQVALRIHLFYQLNGWVTRELMPRLPCRLSDYNLVYTGSKRCKLIFLLNRWGYRLPPSIYFCLQVFIGGTRNTLI